jgi:hypothetical protein
MAILGAHLLGWFQLCSLKLGDLVDNAVQSAVNPESLLYFRSDAAMLLTLENKIERL